MGRNQMRQFINDYSQEEGKFTQQISEERLDHIFREFDVTGKGVIQPKEML